MVDWDSIYSSGIENAENAAAQGRSSVEITLTPDQRIGSHHEEDNLHWTAAKAYRRAFDNHIQELFTKEGFVFSRRMQPSWHNRTFLYCFTLCWSEDGI